MKLTLRTTRKITLEEAKIFEDEQGAKGIKKLEILHPDPCYWEVEIINPILFSEFSAEVVWRQVQPIQDSAQLNYAVMFSEKFTLDSGQVQSLWSTMEIDILSTDTLLDKLPDVIEYGALLWVGVTRNIFGIGTEGFETIQ